MKTKSSILSSPKFLNDEIELITKEMNPNLFFHQGKDSYFFSLKSSTSCQKLIFFYTVHHLFPQTDRKQERLQKVEGRILKRQKIPFSSITQRGIFPKMILDSFFLSFIFFWNFDAVSLSWLNIVWEIIYWKINRCVFI